MVDQHYVFWIIRIIHVDHEVARAAGLRDVNLNIIATGGLIGRYLTDWSGPEGVLRRLDYRLATPVYPGDTLTQTGRVVKKSACGAERLVDLEFTFSVAAGPHAWGTATMALPPPGAVTGEGAGEGEASGEVRR